MVRTRMNPRYSKLVTDLVMSDYDCLFMQLRKFDQRIYSSENWLHGSENLIFRPKYYLKGYERIMIMNGRRFRSYSYDISGIIQNYLYNMVGVACKIVYGKFKGSGERYARSRFGRHCWVELPDGTIIDGAYAKFQPRTKKNPIPLKILRKGDKMYSKYVKSNDEPTEKPSLYIKRILKTPYSIKMAREEWEYWHGDKECPF